MARGMQLSNDELAIVNGRLGEIIRETGWTRTIAIGDLIVEWFFSGQCDAFDSRKDAWRHPSIRQLADRPDCPLRKTALAQAIGVYAVVRKDPALREFAGITPAHIALLVSFPTERRRELLVQAEAAKWSVRVLAQVAKELRGPSADSKAIRSASARQALNWYRSGLKSMQAGLRLLRQQEGIDPSVANEIAGTIRATVLVLGETGDVLRATKRATTDAPEDGTETTHSAPPRRPKAALAETRKISSAIVVAGGNG